MSAELRKITFKARIFLKPSHPKLISSQKIRSSSYSNFSVLGLAIVLIVGGLIILLGFSLEFLIDLVERRLRRIVKYSRLEWFANGIL